MTGVTKKIAVRNGREPWFQQHPRRALAVATVLFLAIFALRAMVEGVDDAIAMLYVLPVALVGIGFGHRAGIAAGLIAIALLVAWTLWAGETLSPLGWVSRVTPLLLIGGLVGSASERMRDAHEAERRAAAIALLQREGAEINDDIVQGLAAAKWMLEVGDLERGLTTLEDTMITAQRLVTKVLGSESVLPEDVRRGNVSRSSSRGSTAPE